MDKADAPLMEVAEVLHMNAGIGETSYAMNSLLQQTVIRMTRPITEEAMRKLYTTTSGFPAKLAIADLGCSSGPNALLAVSDLIKTVGRLCDHQAHNRKYPEFQVFLNDLPGNDFNTVFRSIQTFQEKLKSETETTKQQHHQYSVFVNGVPGSFYGRLFPTESLHFVHSSYSLHWRSRLPGGLEGNKGNIHMAKSSPRGVLEAYYAQFRSDFASFLECRAVEMVAGGVMVLTLPGRRSDQERDSKECCYYWELLSVALNQMASQGMIDQEKLDGFNIPQYPPSPTEVEAEVVKQGSFAIDRLEVSAVSWDVCNSGTNDEGQVKNGAGYGVAKCMRAVAEPLMVSHLGAGKEVVDEAFRRYAAIASEWMANEKTEFVNVTVSLTKKVASPEAHE